MSDSDRQGVPEELSWGGDEPAPMPEELLAELEATPPDPMPPPAPEAQDLLSGPRLSEREIDSALSVIAPPKPSIPPETRLSIAAESLFGKDALEALLTKDFSNFKAPKVHFAPPPTSNILEGEALETKGPNGGPYHLSSEKLTKLNTGMVYDHYRQILPWLQPVFAEHEESEEGEKPKPQRSTDAIACRPPWKPITQGWGPFETELLWGLWGTFLPLMADPSVEEIWVQRCPNHPSDPTPAGYLDVLSDGARGVRIHPSLRIPEENLATGFMQILAATEGKLYSPAVPEGLAVIESALEMEGCRLVGGVPPASQGPFAAIRIPARIRPDLATIIGAKKFSATLRDNMISPGEPLPIPNKDFLEEARKLLEENRQRAIGTDGIVDSIMLPLEALEYISRTYMVGWNIAYSGATSAAKTTVLNAACTMMPPRWRVVTVEKGVAELRLPHVNWVPLFAFDPDKQKIKGLSEPEVLMLAMRMSPRPIPCGEIRGIEGGLFVDLTQTGHESSPTTIHSGNAQECLMRIMKMVMASEGKKGSTISEATARETTANAVDVVVQLRRTEYQIDGVTRSLRRCVEIVEIQKSGSSFEGNFQVKLVPIFETEIDRASGKPILKYMPGRSKLWEVMEKQYLHKDVPTWARADQPKTLEDA